MTTRIDRPTLVGLGLAAVAAVVYWLCNRYFEAGHPDFFYLADAFLHGRTWLDFRAGPERRHHRRRRASTCRSRRSRRSRSCRSSRSSGRCTADQLETGDQRGARRASVVGMCWWLRRADRRARLVDRLWLRPASGFSTQILWITTRGGVWHTGHLIATLLTLGCLIELCGQAAGVADRAARRGGVPDPGAARVRGPVLRAAARRPTRSGSRGRWPWRAVAQAGGSASSPSIAFFFLYNRPGSGRRCESGYALATLPPFLEAQRAAWGCSRSPTSR